MREISQACEALIREGLAARVSGEAIRFNGEIDNNKLADVERSYAHDFQQRLLRRSAREREAGKKYHDFVITY